MKSLSLTLILLAIVSQHTFADFIGPFTQPEEYKRDKAFYFIVGAYSLPRSYDVANAELAPQGPHTGSVSRYLPAVVVQLSRNNAFVSGYYGWEGDWRTDGVKRTLLGFSTGKRFLPILPDIKIGPIGGFVYDRTTLFDHKAWQTHGGDVSSWKQHDDRGSFFAGLSIADDSGFGGSLNWNLLELVDSPAGSSKLEYHYKFSFQVWFRLFGYVPQESWEKF